MRANTAVPTAVATFTETLPGDPQLERQNPISTICRRLKRISVPVKGRAMLASLHRCVAISLRASSRRVGRKFCRSSRLRGGSAQIFSSSPPPLRSFPPVYFTITVVSRFADNRLLSLARCDCSRIVSPCRCNRGVTVVTDARGAGKGGGAVEIKR